MTELSPSVRSLMADFRNFERRGIRDRPGNFFARPIKEGGKENWLHWEAGVPGPENTPWEGATYTFTIQFGSNHPAVAPVVYFKPGFFHMNVFSSGRVCLSLFNDDWHVGVGISQILLAMQDLLENPNPYSPANRDALELYTNNITEYNARITKQKAQYPLL